MSQIQISKVSERGEHSWGLTLVDDQQSPLLTSETPMSKGVALTVAKTLKHKGADSPILQNTPDATGRPVWVIDKDSVDRLTKFSLIKETQFKILGKIDKGPRHFSEIEEALKNVQDHLRKAEIEWNPPEADPAHGEKTTDLTPEVAVPGS